MARTDVAGVWTWPFNSVLVVLFILWGVAGLVWRKISMIPWPEEPCTNFRSMAMYHLASSQIIVVEAPPTPEALAIVNVRYTKHCITPCEIWQTLCVQGCCTNCPSPHDGHCSSSRHFVVCIFDTESNSCREHCLCCFTGNNNRRCCTLILTFRKDRLPRWAEIDISIATHSIPYMVPEVNLAVLITDPEKSFIIINTVWNPLWLPKPIEICLLLIKQTEATCITVIRRSCRPLPTHSPSQARLRCHNEGK